MRLPTRLSHRKQKAYKNQFGHVLVLAGSQRMLGAAALTGLSAMRCGAGLVTIGIPKSLNLTLQKKLSPVIMTWPLAETKDQSLALSAFTAIAKEWHKFSCIALGPGLSTNSSTQKLMRKVVSKSPCPLVIDADGLNALVGHTSILNTSTTPKILTPHIGEMTRLLEQKFEQTQEIKKTVAKAFASQHQCTLLLKGHHTIVAPFKGRIYTNTTGNSGMATAGSGDVLTGMIAAFMAQGLNPFDAGKYGAYLHGLAGDLAAEKKTKISLIAQDIIEHIPAAIKFMQKK